ncbi:Lrp/AsnC family transcriptional regulator [Paenarthrobacter sp. Z7-10]|uniref:Lrp/AsnC family transcriptional regulator n=1 Tax=Paenarthrobacter sp. Z7-10 TaxID=2787635 RepID=UPI0022A9C548|nr:Lrp/AsnC family transcriptional regulator [Paenarthrobacter sp. Z7-10]MCZ2403290.1 Lrp/AsnC family transcriptional regulator [Paenarthrobacter sp. Z7-10]
MASAAKTPSTGRSVPAVNTTGPDTLDEIDRRIIDALVADARMTNRDLAEAVGIAPSTALMRTRSLMERRAIEGFTARLNLNVIGRSVQALIAVRLRAHDRDEIDRFTSTVPRLPEVLSTFHVSGAVDYLLHIAVPNTDVLRDWVLDNLTTDPVVGQTETTLVFSHMPGHAGPLT